MFHVLCLNIVSSEELVVEVSNFEVARYIVARLWRVHWSVVDICRID